MRASSSSLTSSAAAGFLSSRLLVALGTFGVLLSLDDPTVSSDSDSEVPALAEEDSLLEGLDPNDFSEERASSGLSSEQRSFPELELEDALRLEQLFCDVRGETCDVRDMHDVRESVEDGIRLIRRTRLILRNQKFIFN